MLIMYSAASSSFFLRGSSAIQELLLLLLFNSDSTAHTTHLQRLVAGRLEVEQGQLVVGRALRLPADGLEEVRGHVQLPLALLQLPAAEQRQPQAVPDLGLVLAPPLLFGDGEALLQVLHGLRVSAQRVVNPACGRKNVKHHQVGIGSAA